VKYFFCLFLLVLSESALAETIFTVVGFQCDQTKDILVLTYDGAYDYAGEELVRNKKSNQWDLWSLYDNRKTIQQRCRLSDGDYDLSISIYSTGSCNECYGIWAKIMHGDKSVFNEGLDGFEGPPIQTVIVRAVIRSHDEKPELTRLSWDDFVERVHLPE
jgi:hypothetical protein